MRLARAEIENFQKITVLDITFGDHITEISGPNGSGKSSTFAALHASLLSLAMPKDPIRHGAEVAAIRTHLKDDDDSVLLVTKRIRQGDDGKLDYDVVLETPEGARYPQAATHLKKLVSDHLLDPLEFLDMDDDKQIKVLRSFASDFDFDANQRQHDGLFAKRTEVNNNRKREQAAAGAIKVPSDTLAEPVNVAALSAEVEAAITHNASIATRKTNRENAEARIVELRQGAERIRSGIAAEVAAIEKTANDTIADLQQQIDALVDRQNRVAVQASVDGNDLRQKREAEAAQRSTEADALAKRISDAGELPAAIPDADIQAKRQAITDAESKNQAVALRKRQAEHQRNAESYEKESKDLTAKLTALDHAKQDAIRKANLPSGLGFGDGFVTLNGVRLSQASQGDRYRTAFALCMAKRPTLRFCWIRDAALLDETNWQLIDQLAHEFDCQVLLETIKPNTSNAIVLEDGHVKGLELEPKLTAVAKPVAVDSGAPAEQLPADPTDQKPKKRRTWQGPGAPTEGAA